MIALNWYNLTWWKKIKGEIWKGKNKEIQR
jgi:hypothetical protein